MASFVEECRRVLGMEWRRKRAEARSALPVDGVVSAEEMAEWHYRCAAVDLQLITRCSQRSALGLTADFVIDSMHKEPMDEHERTPAEPPAHLICSFHEAVALLRTYVGTANNARRSADRSDLARDDPASETLTPGSSVVRAALKLAILMETAAGLAFFGWVLNGG